jgi:hypothetical protein
MVASVRQQESAVNSDGTMNHELADVELDAVSAASYGKIDVAILLKSTGATCPRDTGTGSMGAALNYIDTMMKW